MIQLLIWGVCVMILALGYIAKQVYTLTLPIEKRTGNTGTGIFIIYLILAAFIAIVSVLLGNEIGRLFSQ